ncbi:MAG: penicillin-binding protein 2 [Magnetococcales bacterium]|nr:penicillin-binding protein 2 [Magnetococcales bacterium]
MAILRQNRHRPDPPERKSQVKRQRGAVAKRQTWQRTPGNRAPGAVAVGRKGPPLLKRLLGLVLPSGRKHPAPGPVTTRENKPSLRREGTSLIGRLKEALPRRQPGKTGIRGRPVESGSGPIAMDAPSARETFSSRTINPPAPRRETQSFFARLFRKKTTPSPRPPAPLPPPPSRDAVTSGDRQGAGSRLAQGLFQKVIQSVSRPPPAGKRPPASRPVPPPPPRDSGSTVRAKSPPLIQRLMQAGGTSRPLQRAPMPPRPPIAPRPSFIRTLFTPGSKEKSPFRPSLIRSFSSSTPAPYVDKSNPRARLGFLMGVFMLAFFVLSLRAVDLTIIQADSLQQRARSQHKKKIVMTADRGRILDRNGRTLAISLPMHSLSVDIDQVDNRDQLATSLGPIIHFPVTDLRSRLLSFKPGSFPILRRKLSPETARKIRNLDHPALFFIPESRRFYTMGEITSHILGFVNFEGRGREGVERSFEDELHGINGAQVISHDRLGRPMPMVKTVTDPHPGSELAITIDTTIQYIAYRALLKGVQASQAKAGMAVVLNPDNGEILAMVNQPSFNPNNLPQSKSNDRRNRVVTDLFEPGSTFKVFTIAAALDAGTVTPSTVIDIEFGKTRVADRIITDFHRGERYHTVSQVLQRSSNVGAAKIGLELGHEKMERYIRLFGFGAPTGIELPADPSGVIPDITHYRKVGLANRSYGYGITTTPLHITAAFAASINGGIYYPPTLIRGKMVDGVLVPLHKPRQPHRVISEDTSKKLRSILQSVVTPEGTAIEAAVDGYQVGGKTGTARKAIPGQGYVRGRYYASFVGFIPVEKPKVVIFVSIDEPSGIYYGGKVAAPVFKEIAQEILPRLSIFPDTHTAPPLPGMMDPPVPSVAPVATKGAIPADPNIAPAVEGVENVSLGKAIEILSKQGIVPRIQGHGMVKSLETPKEGPPRLILQ